MASSNKKYRWIWLSVLVLIACVAATTFELVARLNEFQLDDSGAIPLVSEKSYIINPDSSAEESNNEGAEESAEESAASPSDTQQNGENSASGNESVIIGNAKPGFSASDDNVVWATETNVEIFRASYENGEGVITVKSNNGDKVIAPGTENSYTFKFKNTGNVPLEYDMLVEAYFTSASGDLVIPLESRLSRYDGKWLVGGRNEFEPVSALDHAEDKDSLGAGKYTYYTLDWVWPFESGNDEFDTLLGSLSEDEEVTFTIKITTTATGSDEGGGITPPQTGDESKLNLWISLSIGSFLLLLLFIVLWLKDKRNTDSEAKEN